MQPKLIRVGDEIINLNYVAYVEHQKHTKGDALQVHMAVPVAYGNSTGHPTITVRGEDVATFLAALEASTNGN
ncbi:hypothetical protein VT84_05155 [Gemmata sp. SH-PL17]|uniref:hypothetical protein n=1 Tax=Gemmata sp. SH-PL17 TaxID=1630693 RepID=UPI0004AE0F88|nr:hypothetical protein [Gemmata sp. SH-PL17]AMV23778.1 hypothetical protein VT84_05155 [Gemmata sp. SH-PL17]